MQKFQYDVEAFAKLVEERPCLWNPNIESFKDKAERQCAWREVCARLHDNFDQMSEEEQKKTLEIVNAKWQNLRDCFVRSIRRRNKCRKYIFHDNLKFLLVRRKDLEYDRMLSAQDFSSEPSNSQSNYEDCEVKIEVHSPTLQEMTEFKYDTSSEQYSREQNEIDLREQSTSAHPERRGTNSNAAANEERLRRTRKLVHYIDRAILKREKAASKTKMDQDEAFFVSITPSVSSMTEEQKIEFRMGVLRLIKDIKNKNHTL